MVISGVEHVREIYAQKLLLLLYFLFLPFRNTGILQGRHHSLGPPPHRLNGCQPRLHHPLHMQKKRCVERLKTLKKSLRVEARILRNLVNMVIEFMSKQCVGWLGQLHIGLVSKDITFLYTKVFGGKEHIQFGGDNQ